MSEAYCNLMVHVLLSAVIPLWLILDWTDHYKQALYTLVGFNQRIRGRVVFAFEVGQMNMIALNPLPLYHQGCSWLVSLCVI